MNYSSLKSSGDNETFPPRYNYDSYKQTEDENARMYKENLNKLENLISQLPL